MTFKAPIIKKLVRDQELIWYRVATLKSSAVLRHHQVLSNLIIYLSESIPHGLFVFPEEPKFRKDLSLVFSRRTVESNYQEIKSQLEDLISKISKETELIQQDHLAKGDFVYAIQTFAKKSEGESKYWRIDTKPFITSIDEGDPDEYWGSSLNFYPDIVTSTRNYPWMPTEVSPEAIPF